MNVCYHGPLFDYSGYGEANRHAVAALHEAGVNVIAKAVTYSIESSDFGDLGELMDKLVTNEGDYKIKILHTTPDQYHKHLEAEKYHIGHFFWETDKIPEEFARGLNLMDEIWTGSVANRDAIVAGGVNTPIKIYPQATQTKREWPEKYEINDFDGYLFYSIFEWTDRKNPLGLLDSYWREFQNGENVGLLIKTYFKNFTLQNQRMIRAAIQKAKAKSGLDKFPPVFVYMDLMDRRHIMRVHKTGDCYVSPHRGEGWGIPVVEAMLAGHPAIVTEYAGVNEWLDNGNTAITLPYEMVPLDGMLHSARWYSADQKWAEPDLAALRAGMRSVYEDREMAADLGARGKKFVEERFSFSVVGAEMASRLKEIEESL